MDDLSALVDICDSWADLGGAVQQQGRSMIQNHIYDDMNSGAVRMVRDWLETVQSVARQANDEDLIDAADEEMANIDANQGGGDDWGGEGDGLPPRPFQSARLREIEARVLARRHGTDVFARLTRRIAGAFPGAGDQVYYNDAGEPMGWDSPGEPEHDPDNYRQPSGNEMDHEEAYEQGISHAENGEPFDPPYDDPDLLNTYIEAFRDAGGTVPPEYVDRTGDRA